MILITAAGTPINPVTPAGLALIVAAAFVHVVPHASIKHAADRNAFVWWILATNAVAYAPLLWISIPHTWAAWSFITASGTVEVIYLLSISRAYSLGNLSVIYPVARGTAPLFLLGATIVFLHERPTGHGVAGILLISGGVFAALGRRAENADPARSSRALVWALFSGVLTATYTTIDKAGIARVHPLVYIYLVLVVTLVLYTPLMAMRRETAETGADAENGWTRAVSRIATARRSAGIGRIALAGLSMPLAYALVLTAMRHGMPASYAGSLREMSVLVAAGVGVLLFNERVRPAQIAGAISIVTGIALIALRG